MKLENIDEFFSFSDINYSCMEYVRADEHGSDLLFVGSFCGRVNAFLFSKRKVPRTLRPEDISRDMSHSGEVTCLMHSYNPKLSLDAPSGVLYSGSTDRTIKVWMANSSSPKLLQTLYGHEGSLTQLADAHDGTMLSCSVDGSLRLWKPQRGRAFLSQAFLECTCVIRSKNVWLSAMAVNSLNSWACYVADLDGNVEIFKKGSEHNEAEQRTAIFTGQLTRHKRWEKVHRLGITQLCLVAVEHLLVTAASDYSAKILDMHLGTTLYTIPNPRNCKYTGVVWDIPKFQVYLSDEQGFLEVWSSFYERTVETFSMSSWTGTVRVGRGDGVGPKANLLAQPLVSSLTQHQRAGLVVTLHPRAGSAAIWEITNEGTVSKFAGHDGKLILSLGIIENPSNSIPPAADQHQAKHLRESRDEGKSNDLISLEESTFFSVGEDNMLCCWDEYDRTERYSIRLKHSSEVVCVLTVWSLHSIATAHDCGAVCLWNIDSGTKVVTNDMRGSAITAFALGKNKHRDDVLLAVDRDGRIGVWNLTLFKAHLSTLPLEHSVFVGFHDPDDPSIVSVDVHVPSGTVFTGGSDGHIKYWRLKVDNEAETLDFHEGHSIWNLYARQSFLLSGDESGRVVLWSIEQDKPSSSYKLSGGPSASPTPAASSANSPVKSASYRGSGGGSLTLTRLAVWTSAMQGSFQCCYLDQVNGRAYVCVTDVSCKFSTLWKVSRRGGGTLESFGAPEEGGFGAVSAVGVTERATEKMSEKKDKRKKRVSMSADVEGGEEDAKATASYTVANSNLGDSPHASASKVASLTVDNLRLQEKQQKQEEEKEKGRGAGVGNLSLPFQEQRQEEEGLSAAKLTKLDTAAPTSSSHPSSCRGHKSGGAFSSAGGSRRSSYAQAQSMHVVPSLLTIQLDFDSIATIKHDLVKTEPSCMRCRVGKARLAGAQSGPGGAYTRPAPAKGAETCVYLGLMDGSIHKYTLGEIF